MIDLANSTLPSVQLVGAGLSLVEHKTWVVIGQMRAGRLGNHKLHSNSSPHVPCFRAGEVIALSYGSGVGGSYSSVDGLMSGSNEYLFLKHSTMVLLK